MLVALAGVAGCRHRAPAPLPGMVSAPISDPVPTPVPAPAPPPQPENREPERRITLTGEWDVRLALEEIAKTAGYNLAISPQVQPMKLRLSLINVPASDALQTVLYASNLTLEGTHRLQVPWNPSVVYYQLPVNVDSLSAAAIMKRYGVSRDIANLILEGRRP